MTYVDGYVLPLPKKNVGAYRKLAELGARVWREHGALSYRECVGEHLNTGYAVPFTKILKTKPGETVVFAWVEFKSRAHRDRVNKKVFDDPRLAEMGKKMPMPFDCKRMVCGGFETIVKG